MPAEAIPEPDMAEPGGNNDAIVGHNDDKLVLARNDNDEKTESKPTYVLTLDDDPNWTYGNPTGISTRTEDSATVTLLFFTRTTFIWNAGAASYFTDGGTPITTLPAVTLQTTVTVISTDEERTTSPESSEFTTTGIASTSLDASSTEVISSTDSTATTVATESPMAGDSADLPQAAVIGISVGISVLTFVLFLGAVVWCIRRKRHQKVESVVAEAPVDRSWEPKFDSMQHGQGSQTPTINSNLFPIPDLAQQGHQSMDFGHGQNTGYRLVPQQQAPQQPQTPQPMAPHQQPSPNHMAIHQQPLHQSVPQPAPQQTQQHTHQQAYTAWHPSMDASNQQHFAVELPSDNYRR